VQSHEDAVALLAQRVRADQSLGVGHRARAVSGCRQLFERRQVQALEPLALLPHPRVIAALEEIARVDRDRRFGVAECQRTLERCDVELHRSAPAQRPGGHLEAAVRLRQRVPQGMQDVAQVRARLRLARVRPQEARDPRPRLRRVPVQQQIGEQRLGARRLQRRQRRVAEPQTQLSEQRYAKGGRFHRPSLERSCRERQLTAGALAADRLRRAARTDL
jgi:hypothetical protein